MSSFMLSSISQQYMTHSSNDVTQQLTHNLHMLKCRFNTFLKEEAGKGAFEIRIQIDYTSLSIVLKSFLTQYELSLIKNDTNRTLVEYNRSIFFQNRVHTIEQLTKQALHQDSVKLKTIQIDALRDLCTLHFMLDK